MDNQQRGDNTCGCLYADKSGFSTMDNELANIETGAWSGDKFICIKTTFIGQ